MGADNVKEIAAVKGVDVLFVGPFDLAKSMDIEFGGEEHERTIQSVLEAARGEGKKAAIFCESGRLCSSNDDGGDFGSHPTFIVRRVMLTLIHCARPRPLDRRLGGTSETSTRSRI